VRRTGVASTARTARPGSPRRRNAGRRHVGCAAHLGARRAHMPMDDRGVTDPYRVSLPPSDRDAAS
jgi:hypothetical protein